MTEDEKYWKKRYFFAFAVLIFYLLLVLFLVVLLFNIKLSFNKETKIIYDGLNETEIKYFESFIDELKPIYFKVLSEEVGKVIVTKNKTIMEETCGKPCTGNANQLKRKITIYFNGYDSKNTLCHEIFHFLIYGNERFHEIIYDLANQEVCFSPQEN